MRCEATVFWQRLDRGPMRDGIGHGIATERALTTIPSTERTAGWHSEYISWGIIM
jgi:hypothetical protein